MDVVIGELDVKVDRTQWPEGEFNVEQIDSGLRLSRSVRP